MPRVYFSVTVSTHDQERGLAHAPRQVLKEEQRGRIGPMEVIQEEQEWFSASGCKQEVANSIEEAMALSFGAQGRRFGDIWKEPAELGQQLGHVGGAFAQVLSEVFDTMAAKILGERLDNGQVGWHSFRLVGVAREDRQPVVRGVDGQLGDEASLSDTGLAGHHHQAPLASDRGLQVPSQLGAFRLAAHETG